MSIVRTYYGWHLASSPDRSYMLAICGLCSDAEISIGVLVGCFPIMPKFFRYVGPKISEALSCRPKAASEIRDNPAHRPETHTHTKNKNPFAKYKAGSSVVECWTDPYAQLHEDHYTRNGSEDSLPLAATDFAPIQVPGLNVATRRGDLEYGSQDS